MKRALLIVDMQNDFLPGGALAVPHAEEILPSIQQLLKMPFALKIATQDWHPPGHISFASTWERKRGEIVHVEDIDQALWPDHCIQDTEGAKLSSELDTNCFDHIIHKGTDVLVDSYSTFFDNRRKKSTGLEKYLREHRVHDLYIAGLATDYCVFYSAMDAIGLGFQPYVVIDACRGITEEGVERACKIMKEKGVRFVRTSEIH